jgi:hypothetical protein
LAFASKNHQVARAGQTGPDPLHIVGAAHLFVAGGGIIPVFQHARRLALAIAGRIAKPVKKTARRSGRLGEAGFGIARNEGVAMVDDV